MNVLVTFQYPDGSLIPKVQIGGNGENDNGSVDECEYFDFWSVLLDLRSMVSVNTKPFERTVASIDVSTWRSVKMKDLYMLVC